MGFENIIKGDSRIDLESPLIFLQQKDPTTLKEEYNKVLNLFNNNDYSKSLELGLKLLKRIEIEQNTEMEYLCTFLIGELFRKLKNHEKSLIYYNRSLKILKNIKKDNILEFKYHEKTFLKDVNIANNLLKIGVGHYRLRNNDSAKIFYNKVIKINSLNKEYLPIKASALHNLSNLYIRSKKYVEARNYLNEAINIRREINDKLNEASTLSSLASIYLLEKNYIKAKEVYKKAIKLIEFDESSTAYAYKQSFYFNLAWTLYLLKDYTAYEYQEMSYEIKDSLRSQNFEHVVKGVFEKHQIELEKEKVNLAKQQVALKKAEEKRTNWFLGILMVLILGISGFVLYTYKLRQRNLKLKLEQTEFAQKSKLDKLKSESQVRILNATLDGKETERKQIAETLHDSVSSLLSSANLHLQATKMQFNGDTPIEIDKTQKIIIEASQTIRDLSHTLVSSVLLKFGLKYAIKDMAEKYSNSQLKIDTNIKNVRRYHQGFEIKVNNIVQEFVNNILKHSNATKALVRVEDKEGVLHINIQDDGEGFDKRDIPKKDGLGINQIDARIQMMKGKFLINSSAETGTIIEIELPIKEKETTVNA